MKGKQGNNLPHNVPLSKQALLILKEELNTNGKIEPTKVIFSYKRNISENAVWKLIRLVHRYALINGHNGFTIHGHIELGLDGQRN